MKNVLIGILLALNGCNGGGFATSNQSEAAVDAQAQALSDQTNQTIDAQINAIQAASPPPPSAPPPAPPTSAASGPAK